MVKKNQQDLCPTIFLSGYEEEDEPDDYNYLYYDDQAEPEKAGPINEGPVQNTYYHHFEHNFQRLSFQGECKGCIRVNIFILIIIIYIILIYVRGFAWIAESSTMML